jgi:hypothetical protein
MATLNLNIGIQVTNGPQINVNRSREIEAFDKVDVSLAGGATVTVDLQPGKADQIALLLIKSSKYDKKITLKLKDSAAESPQLTLEEPQVFVNDGGTLFKVDPAKVELKSALGNDPANKADIEIFVARRAQP